MFDVKSELQFLRPALLRTAKRFALGHDAEDLVQEASIRALESRETLNTNTNLRAWMTPVLRNLAIDEHRRMRHLAPFDECKSIPNPAEDQPPAWAAFERMHVERALSECSRELRTAFELHYWQELPLDAIAHHLGIPRATVGTRLYRARIQLRKVLERNQANA